MTEASSERIGSVEWFTIDQFCKWAGISRSFFYRGLASENKAPTIRKMGRKSIILKSDAQAWLDALPKKQA